MLYKVDCISIGTSTNNLRWSINLAAKENDNTKDQANIQYRLTVPEAPSGFPVSLGAERKPFEHIMY